MSTQAQFRIVFQLGYGPVMTRQQSFVEAVAAAALLRPYLPKLVIDTKELRTLWEQRTWVIACLPTACACQPMVNVRFVKLEPQPERAPATVAQATVEQTNVKHCRKGWRDDALLVGWTLLFVHLIRILTRKLGRTPNPSPC
ncbi:MAG: hypothetical protein K8U03_09150 [Planctomycetia bacterium]|nr:hypothetical protein [Planctomycetia bacterium]